MVTPNLTNLNIHTIVEFIDQRRLGKRQLTILLLCGLLMVLDGFDVQSISYVAPAILQDWHLEKAQLGVVFSSGLFGLLLGSLIFSYFSDKFGRRPILLGATLFFAVCMFVTAWVDNLTNLVIIRFLTGLGLGAIMPNAMALCGEITPRRQRISVMMMISCGFTIGAMLGGFLAAYMIPQFGWRSIFWLGGILPLFTFFLLFFLIPESLQFMGLKNSKHPKIASTLQTFYPNDIIPSNFATPQSTNKASILSLFEANRAKFTLSIWLISILNLISLYFLSSWLPTLAKAAGLSLQNSVLLGAVLQLGGTIGTFVMGFMIDKKGFYKILIPCFIIATIFIVLLGNVTQMLVLFFVVVFIVGFTVIGGQPALNAMSANYYPTEIRTTGVGWSLGVGRIGSVIGPVLGGWLVQYNLPPEQLFLFVAIPSVLIIATFLVQKSGRFYNNSAG